MIIERINIKSFGLITDMTLDFSQDVNVIVGKNEAGKSTIAAFIKYMLYGFLNEETPGVTDERARRVNWDNGTAQGSMTVRVGDKRYLINRVTEKVSSGQRITYKEDSSIIDLETGSPAFGKVPAGEIFFGVDRELFENTAFIGQIGDSSINEGSVRESIENILFSGSEKINNQRAASKVSAKVETLLHKSGAGGIIFELERRSEQLKERFVGADEDNKKILAKEAELHELRTQKKNEEELLEKLCDLDVCYRNVELIKTFDRLHELEGLLEKKVEEYNSFISENTRAGFVPTDSYLTDIAVSRRGVDDAYRTLLDARDAYEEQKRVAGITRDTEAQIELSDRFGGEAAVEKDVAKKKFSIIRDIAAMSLLALLALSSVVFLLVEKDAKPLVKTLFIILSTGSVLGIGYMLFDFFKARAALAKLSAGFGTQTTAELLAKLKVIAEDRAKRDKLVNDTENTRLALESSKDKYEKAKAELLEVILRWGEEPPKSNLSEFLDNLAARVKAFLEKERSLISEKGEIESAIREAKKVVADKSEIEVRGQVSPLKRKVLAQIDYEQIIAGIAECKEKIEKLGKLAKTAEDELAALKLRATDPGELYAKMQENDARIAELRHQYESAILALRCIENASNNLRLEISPRLAEYSAELLGIMTDKKYSDIDVSEGLKMSFVSPSGEKKSVDFLSGGTRDMVYIALRISLIDMLFAEKPPMVFDESFAHQDNARAKSMMRAIGSLSEAGQQSFIFTCREREGTLARELASSAQIFKLSSDEPEL